MTQEKIRGPLVYRWRANFQKLQRHIASTQHILYRNLRRNKYHQLKTTKKDNRQRKSMHFNIKATCACAIGDCILILTSTSKKRFVLMRFGPCKIVKGKRIPDSNDSKCDAA